MVGRWVEGYACIVESCVHLYIRGQGQEGLHERYFAFEVFDAED